MICYHRCPHCGLRFGRRTEPVGDLYRCRKCRGVVLFASRNSIGETLFMAKPDAAAGDRDLLTVPRV